jgi:hypothetical protein
VWGKLKFEGIDAEDFVRIEEKCGETGTIVWIEEIEIRGECGFRAGSRVSAKGNRVNVITGVCDFE